MEHRRRIHYSPRTDVTPEHQAVALTSVYRYILFESSRAKEKAAKRSQPDGPNDVKESSEHIARTNLHEE